MRLREVYNFLKDAWLMRQAGRGTQVSLYRSSNSFFTPYLPCVQAPWQLVAVVPLCHGCFPRINRVISQAPHTTRKPNQGGTEREKERKLGSEGLVNGGRVQG